MRLSLFLCLALSLPAIAISQEKKPDSLKAEIQGMYDKIAAAFERKDIDALTQFSLPDAKTKDAAGKEKTLDMIKMGMPLVWAATKSGKSKITVEEVKETGDTAVLRDRESLDMVIVPKGEVEKFLNYTGQWRATLKKTKDGWRIQYSEELQRKVIIDGELFEEKKAEEAKDPKATK